MTAKLIMLAISILFVILSSNLPPADKASITNAPLPSALLAAQAKTSVAARVSFLEGPAFDEGGTLYFSDIAGNRIMKMAPTGRSRSSVPTAAEPTATPSTTRGASSAAKGPSRAPDGRRRLVRTDVKTGDVEVLTERYEGKRYNSPNDVCVDSKGRIWFTDPYYGEDRDTLEMDVDAVYRIDPDGKVTRVLTQPEIERPNGIAITPDDKTLYVIDSHPQPGGNRKIWAFDVSADGQLSKQRLVFDFGKGRGGDGMRLDRKATSGSPPASSAAHRRGNGRRAAGV